MKQARHRLRIFAGSAWACFFSVAEKPNANLSVPQAYQCRTVRSRLQLKHMTRPFARAGSALSLVYSLYRRCTMCKSLFFQHFSHQCIGCFPIFQAIVGASLAMRTLPSATLTPALKKVVFRVQTQGRARFVVVVSSSAVCVRAWH